MTVTVQQIVVYIQTLRPSKWHWYINHLAESLEITAERANSFIRCIEKVGYNTLNLHYKESVDKSRTSFGFEAPSSAILDQPSRHVFVGRISSQNKSIAIKVQREIVKYVIGTHNAMT